uniref:Uncharacterized protein n=1 Tax=Arundo donax TaxID=35708 RepID=A0A0A9HHL0_ARUDO
MQDARGPSQNAKVGSCLDRDSSHLNVLQGTIIN